MKKSLILKGVLGFIFIFLIFINLGKASYNNIKTDFETPIINTLSIKSFFEGILGSITGGSKLKVD